MMREPTTDELIAELADYGFPAVAQDKNTWFWVAQIILPGSAGAIYVNKGDRLAHHRDALSLLLERVREQTKE